MLLSTSSVPERKGNTHHQIGRYVREGSKQINIHEQATVRRNTMENNRQQAEFKVELKAKLYFINFGES